MITNLNLKGSMSQSQEIEVQIKNTDSQSVGHAQCHNVKKEKALILYGYNVDSVAHRPSLVP